MFHVVKAYMENLVTAIPGVKISLIGGIQINAPKPVGDLFQPLMFEVRLKD